jgi:hypothetical protein
MINALHKVVKDKEKLSSSFTALHFSTEFSKTIAVVGSFLTGFSLS